VVVIDAPELFTFGVGFYCFSANSRKYARLETYRSWTNRQRTTGTSRIRDLDVHSFSVSSVLFLIEKK